MAIREAVEKGFLNTARFAFLRFLPFHDRIWPDQNRKTCNKGKTDMKKGRILLLALVFCAAFAVSASAADYGALTISGNNQLYEASEVTITFEAASLETGTLRLAFGGEAYDVENANIITVLPGSAVQVADSVNGDSTAVWPYSLFEGNYEEYPRGASIASGSVDDWVLGKSLMGGGDIVGLLNFSCEQDGQPVSYFIMLGEEGAETPAADAPVTGEPLETAIRVVPTSQRLTVDGVEQNAEIYNIDGSNYFKLRDVAMMLNGSSSQFSVSYDGASNSISIVTGEPYEPNGTELQLITREEMTRKAATAESSAQSLLINGAPVALPAFNIGGNNYVGLRNLGSALGFGVTYDEDSATMIVTSR